MFGCIAVYVDDKIMLILRAKETEIHDNGVWLATAREHHDSLKKQFSKMRSIEVLGAAPTNWQNLPSDAADFEESVLGACQLILAGDARIGRVPAERKRKGLKKSKKRK
jgi:hypothetical protein